MDADFQKANCLGCRYSLLAGSDEQGKFRIRRCLFRFAQSSDKNRQQYKGGEDLDKIDTCPKLTQVAA